MSRFTVAAITIAASFAAFGHHSANVTYDVTSVVEVQGEITEISWRNPHVRFKVRAADAPNDIWDIESNSISILQRMGITAERVRVGDRVAVAGAPARRGGNQMFASNMLLPNGEELLLEPEATSRWSTNVVGEMSAWTSDGVATSGADAQQAGIFRVWSTNLTNPDSFPLFPERDTSYPLTDTARAAVAAWANVEDNPYLTCTPMGMPRVMGQPYPIEFVDDGNEILLRIELHDLVRVIDMSAGARADTGQPRSPLGHSEGRWEGKTLVVTTTSMSWPYFNQSGIPQSSSSTIVERFTPSSDGSRLHYALTVTDPETFTEPVTLTKYWNWRPGERILPFDCASDDDF